MKPLTSNAHCGPRHSTDRRPVIASHSGIALRNYTSIIEDQLARIDRSRATLEALAETYGTTPAQAAVEEMRCALRCRRALARRPCSRRSTTRGHEMSLIKRNTNPERDHLISQRDIALNQLACVEERLTEAAVAAMAGDATAFKKYSSLTAEANRYRQEADVFTRAFASLRPRRGPMRKLRSSKHVKTRRTSAGRRCSTLWSTKSASTSSAPSHA